MSAIWLVIREFLTSKKFVVAVAGVLISLAAKYNLNLDPDSVQNIIYVVMAYLVGQGWADWGKEAAKIQGTVAIANSPNGPPTRAVKDKLI